MTAWARTSRASSTIGGESVGEVDWGARSLAPAADGAAGIAPSSTSEILLSSVMVYMALLQRQVVGYLAGDQIINTISMPIIF